MIPKIIHYCWFGGGKIPSPNNKYIQSWNNILIDYKIVLWNESNFNISSIPYTEQAYQARKFAFVTDYVRLFVLYKYGGIYLDTDVELIKSFDDLLNLPGFISYEYDNCINTGTIGCTPFNLWIKEQLEEYKTRQFTINGKHDLTSNVQIISENMRQNNFKFDNNHKIYKNCMHVFPKEYFCPKSRTGIVSKTNKTYCIHHYSGSWAPSHLKWKKFIFHTLLGSKTTDYLVRVKRKLIHSI
ncbi:MAG TPA: glycosyltransferase [Prolixibacteraceae bacterium]|nr:glycosyltransferase [Prolixibacteraceae bacterium]HOS90497.1 glycosyltransferase [Prolixibacteraceae bacterium]HPL45552.1 glycosyltransferase [Prolixibacteraceae bacterium]HQE52610.1 glycosyltransferase [Prolixibacteraceae bacterium]HQJ85809.1 glycosyltransferase [Prolixibacteraceae bacterium]